MLSLMHDGMEGHSFDMWIKAQYPTHQMKEGVQWPTL